MNIIKIKLMNYFQKLTIRTKNKREIVDITEIINDFLKKSNFKNGLCHIFLLHTTSAITTCDLDPETDLDYLNTFEAIVPKIKFNHPHSPSHFPDHFLSSLIGTSLTLPFEESELILGTWQRVVIIEFDGPRKRELIIKISD